jgi:hypothetical protein
VKGWAGEDRAGGDVKDRGSGAGVSDGSIVGIMQVGTGRGRDMEMEYGTWKTGDGSRTQLSRRGESF